ncbi:type II secretion system F family protein [Candidatus Woesearchaeota archaeon]|nr:type II secretion system F family protein [Candidatus Woesearchaeota archaeon]
MYWEFKKKYFIGILIGVAILLLDGYLYFILETKRWFFSLIILALTISWSQFWVDLFKENKRQKEIELQFLEFIRNLVSNVRSGVSIPKSVINTANEDYGALSKYTVKLGRQIEWGIPIHKALVTFANDTGNKVIKRSVSIIIEADESGGDIADILESVATSVVNIKKMREERRSSVFSQIVQGYIVFFVFIGIMLVLQIWLFPRISTIGGTEALPSAISGFTQSPVVGVGEKVNLDFIFFSMLLIQGFFAGIMIGKFSEGTLKQGLIHSLILMTSAALIIFTVKGGF